jgi:hypothetical protein
VCSCRSSTTTYIRPTPHACGCVQISELAPHLLLQLGGRLPDLLPVRPLPRQLRLKQRHLRLQPLPLGRRLLTRHPQLPLHRAQFQPPTQVLSHTFVPSGNYRQSCSISVKPFTHLQSLNQSVFCHQGGVQLVRRPPARPLRRQLRLAVNICEKVFGCEHAIAQCHKRGGFRIERWLFILQSTKGNHALP